VLLVSLFSGACAEQKTIALRTFWFKKEITMAQVSCSVVSATADCCASPCIALIPGFWDTTFGLSVAFNVVCQTCRFRVFVQLEKVATNKYTAETQHCDNHCNVRTSGFDKYSNSKSCERHIVVAATDVICAMDGKSIQCKIKASCERHNCNVSASVCLMKL
jgi:hypothetical protein